MFGAVFDIQQPYHPSWQHPRYDLALRYLEIVLSIVVIALAFPYIFRTPPDTVKNAYFVFTMLLGIFTVLLVLSLPPPPFSFSRAQRLDPSPLPLPSIATHHPLLY